MERMIEMVPRCCECCGEKSPESLGIVEHVARTRKHLWHFRMENVICKTCGFVFVSPAPSKIDLSDYYADSLVPYSKQVQDYDAFKRIEFIQKYKKDTTCFIEIGSSVMSVFQREVAAIFSKFENLELNEQADSCYRGFPSILEKSATMVGHYFVLEHIPYVMNFLLECSRILAPGGVMVIEVPDIRLYPVDIAALICHEHVNHFSGNKLAFLAKKAGFVKVGESSDLCSRNYGIAMAFEKSEVAKQDYACIDEYHDNKNNFLRGLETYKELSKKMQNLYSFIVSRDKEGVKSVLWGANDRLLHFLGNNDGYIFINSVVVDSNPEKRDLFKEFCVFHPEECYRHIVDSDFILIFTRLHSYEIISFIKDKYHKVFDYDKIFIIDC